MRFVAKTFGSIAVLAAVATSAVPALAATDTTTISVQVNNNLSVESTVDLDFGEIIVVPGSDDTAQASITLDPDGTLGGGTAEANGARVVSISTPTVGVYTVDSGVVGSSLDVSVTVTDEVTLEPDTSATSDDFIVTTEVGTTSTGTITTPADCVTVAGCDAQTDATTGTLVFNVGGTLAMAVGNGTYENDTYSGDLVVDAVFK